jgi:hypothetical protein
MGHPKHNATPRRAYGDVAPDRSSASQRPRKPTRVVAPLLRPPWFWIERPLRTRVIVERTGPDEATAHELARLLDRNRRSVRRAIQTGWFTRVGYLPRSGIVVRVDAAQLAAWRAPDPEQVWAAAHQLNAALPAWGPAWRSMDSLTAELALHRDTVRSKLRALNVPLIEWDRDGPFLTQRRYFVPDAGVLRPTAGITRECPLEVEGAPSTRSKRRRSD